MPFYEERQQLIARGKDDANGHYCVYRYKDGAFLAPDAIVEDMIEMSVPRPARKIGQGAAREQLSRHVPTLKRRLGLRGWTPGLRINGMGETECRPSNIMLKQNDEVSSCAIFS